jgi:hypothetical protein
MIGLEKVQNGDVYKFDRELTTNTNNDGTQEANEKRLRKIS